MRIIAFFLGLAVAIIALLCVRAAWIDRKTRPVRYPPRYNADVANNCQGAVDRPVILVGDSRIARWPPHLLSDARVINKGIGGETVSHLAARFAPDVLSDCPSRIVVASGINDLVAASLLDREAGSQVVGQVTRTLSDLAERGTRIGAQVYIATIIPPAKPDLIRRLVWSWSVIDYVNRVNQAIRTTRWPRSVTVLDFALCLDPDSSGILPSPYSADTLHLNEAGYLRLMDLIPLPDRNEIPHKH